MQLVVEIKPMKSNFFILQIKLCYFRELRNMEISMQCSLSKINNFVTVNGILFKKVILFQSHFGGQKFKIIRKNRVCRLSSKFFMNQLTMHGKYIRKYIRNFIIYK